ALPISLPDLIFMDIQLSDGLSFEIFSEIQVKCPVIFTTAYDQYAIRAFEVNSIDYLLKPIEPEKLQAALAKLDAWNRPAAAAVALKPEQLEALLQLHPKAYKSRFVAKVGDRFKRIAAEEVAFFFAEDDVVFIMHQSGKKWTVNYSLQELEALLDPRVFHRINRKFIVHIDAIEEVHKYFNSRLLLKLQPAVEEQVLISRARVPVFMEWMEG
ncbi:MAG: LytTR family DNA-binding domain-containing protein, partial [Bacteroidota bacterium]